MALVAYLAAGVLAAILVANTLSVPVPGATTRYSAVFSDVDGLVPGSDVTLTGVRVGRVDSVSFVAGPDGGSQALVDFEVQSKHALSEQVSAAIRYGDMLGVRYLALVDPVTSSGTSGTTLTAAASLPAGAQIPLSRTTGPVDLTALVNGFKPLFDAIDPAQVNGLARSVVDAFQGESGTISTLLVRIASVSENLADHEQVFGRLVANLNTLLGAVNTRGSEVRELITGLSQLSTSLAEHNTQLITLLDQGSSTVAGAVELFTQSIAPLGQTVTDLKNMTGAWVPNTDRFDETMRLLPAFADSLNHIADYGSFLSLYMCNFTLKADAAEVNLLGTTHSAVCR
ncbi:MCE family protein [Rhodococcus sp. D2-41]|nr:MCE family protein [Rhodococcus sp. D2-41]